MNEKKSRNIKEHVREEEMINIGIVIKYTDTLYKDKYKVH